MEFEHKIIYTPCKSIFTCGPIGDRRSIDRPSLCDAHHDYDYDYDHNKSDSTGSYPERHPLINYTGYAEPA